MNDVVEAILTRRSIRRFEEREIEAPLLEQVLEAARWAPSWANTQCWEFVVVRDAAVKSALQGAIPDGNPGHNAIAAAPVTLVICAHRRKAGFYKGVEAGKFGDWLLFDSGIAAQNIALAAHALGLGTFVLGLFDHEAARAVVNAPEDCEVVCLMPLGYPAQSPPPPPRRPLSETCHENSF